jgi:hypothetical protein
MKSPKVLSVLAVLILLIAAVPLWSVSAGPSDKVGVCHLNDLGGYMMIQVSSKALPAHLAHGDGLPGDPVPNMDGYMFVEDCSVVELPPTMIFDSIPEVLPGSFPSLGYEATSTDEFGDHIIFADDARDLKTVDVSLTDWACENDNSRANNEACVTTPGSSYTHPITLNIYSVKYVSGLPEPDTLLGTITQSFDIPYRPSWDSTMCTGDKQTPVTDIPFGGTWYDPVLAKCVHGYAFVITFDFDSLNINLPDEVIYGIAYNTAHYGSTPLGVNGPYNSLNVSLASVPPFVGTDYDVNEVFWDTSHAGFYCDGGASGVDIFRRDAAPGCWAPYTPVIRFNAGN